MITNLWYYQIGLSGLINSQGRRHWVLSRRRRTPHTARSQPPQTVCACRAANARRTPWRGVLPPLSRLWAQCQSMTKDKSVLESLWDFMRTIDYAKGWNFTSLPSLFPPYLGLTVNVFLVDPFEMINNPKLNLRYMAVFEILKWTVCLVTHLYLCHKEKRWVWMIYVFRNNPLEQLINPKWVTQCRTINHLRIKSIT